MVIWKKSLTTRNSAIWEQWANDGRTMRRCSKLDLKARSHQTNFKWNWHRTQNGSLCDTMLHSHISSAHRIEKVHIYNWNAVFVFQGLAVFMVLNYSEVTYNKTYRYPGWGVGLGWLMSISPVSLIPLYMLFAISRSTGTLKQVRSIGMLKQVRSIGMLKQVRSIGMLKQVCYSLSFPSTCCSLTPHHRDHSNRYLLKTLWLTLH